MQQTAATQLDLKHHYLRCQWSKRGKQPICIGVMIDGNIQNSEVVGAARKSATVVGNASKSAAMVVLDQKAAAKAALIKKKDEADLEIKKALALAAPEREKATKRNLLNQQLYMQSVIAMNCSLSSQLIVEKTNSAALNSQLMVEQK